MAKPPSPTQRRYRGRIRADMRSAYNHLLMLQSWDLRYRDGAVDTYPNQLASVADIATIHAASDTLLVWLNAKGPIPSRVP